MTPEERAAKVAFRLLVDRLGGLDAAASVAAKKRSALAEYYSLDHADRFAPVHVVMRLERVAGEPLVTAVLARAAGLGLAADVARGEDCAVQPLGRFVAAAGALSGEAFAALGDGVIDDAEAASLLRAVDDAERHLAAAKASLRRRPGRGR